MIFLRKDIDLNRPFSVFILGSIRIEAVFKTFGVFIEEKEDFGVLRFLWFLGRVFSKNSPMEFIVMLGILLMIFKGFCLSFKGLSICEGVSMIFCMVKGFSDAV